MAAAGPGIDMDTIYTRDYDLDGSSLEEYVEKLAILTHIFSREFQCFAMTNTDEHKPSELLDTMWNGAFANHDLSEADLAQLFERVNAPYREKLVSLFEHELRRVGKMPG